MTTIKIKSAIQETDISKRLRQFQDDLLKLKLIKKGQDPVQELEGDSGNYIITVELDKTPKELLPLLESLGVPYEGTKYFDEQDSTQYTFAVSKKGSNNIHGYYFPESIKKDETSFNKFKSLIDYVFPNDEYKVKLVTEDEWDELCRKHYSTRESYKELTEQNKDKLKYHFERYFSDLKDSVPESKGFSESETKNFSHVPVSDLKSLVEEVYKFIDDNDLHPRWYDSRKSRISECMKEYEDISNTPAKSGSIESDLMWSTSRLDELNHNINNELGLLLEGCTRNDKELMSKAKSIGVKSEYFSDSDYLYVYSVNNGKVIVEKGDENEFLTKYPEATKIVSGNIEKVISRVPEFNRLPIWSPKYPSLEDSHYFSTLDTTTIKYCTPDGNVGTVVVPSNEAHQKMKELASNGCTKVRITNDEHYTRDNGPRSEVKEEHEFEEMFSALRTRLENAPKDIKQHFNNLINYFSNK